jgi:hypothetical protein
MGDPFEGHYSKPTAAFEQAFVASQLRDKELGKLPNAETLWREHFKILLSTATSVRPQLFLNC